MNPLKTRRNFLRGAAGVTGATIWGGNTLDPMLQYTNTGSKPSELKCSQRCGDEAASARA